MRRTLAPLTATLLLALIATSVSLRAEEGGDEAAPPAPEARTSVTRHAVEIGGEQVAYEATAGWLILQNDDGEPIARFGYTAYEREGVDDVSRRPITFAYNGGPGSSSIWLHMGVLGPRRVVVADADFTLPPPYQLVDNEFSILDVSDLVMIDPVGTGFSRPLGDAEGEDFWGVDQDIESVARFIETWVRTNGRWSSPKILLGESYGGMRSGGVALELLQTHGMALNGVVLVSPYMDFISGGDGIGIDLPHVLFFPTMAATAWYHDAIEDRPIDLEAFLDEVRAFAYDEYAPALLKGTDLPVDERAAVAGKLARYTGTSQAYWERADLRVNHLQFVKELLRDERRTVGRIDSRFAGRSFNAIGESMTYDPFMAAVGPAFTATFFDYYHDELEFGRDLDYAVSGDLWRHWDQSHDAPMLLPWGSTELPFPNTAQDLARAMGLNPHMKVLVQQGYYDLATTFAATEYDIAHMDLLPEQRANIEIAYYEAGHMMYLHPPSLVKYRDDLATFIRETTTRN